MLQAANSPVKAPTAPPSADRDLLADTPPRLDTWGLFVEPKDEQSYRAARWSSLSRRLRWLGLGGGIAYLLSSATDWAVLHGGLGFSVLLALRFFVFLLGLRLFMLAREQPDHGGGTNLKRAADVLVLYEYALAAVFVILVPLYGGRVSAEFQSISVFVMLLALYLYAPMLHVASLWLGPLFAAVFWIEAATVLPTPKAMVVELFILLGFTVVTGAQIAVQTARRQRRAWVDQRRVAEASERLRKVFEVCPVPLVLTRRSDSRILDHNAAFVQLLAQQQGDPGEQTVPGFFAPLYARPADRQVVLDAIDRDGFAGPLDLRLRGSGGQMIDVAFSAVRLDSQSDFLLCSLVEITARKRREEELDRLAQTDVLTGLLNRKGLAAALEQALEQAGKQHQAVAVGYIDLDDFKPVNDTYGHAAGDAVLRELAARLRSIRPGQTVLARIGGDELVAVLLGLDPSQPQPQLQQWITQLHHAVEEDFLLDQGQRARIGMSMGLAIYPRDGADADALLRQADAALYQIKSRKNRRQHWWQEGVLPVEQSASEPPLDAYGPRARQLLAQHRDWFASLADEFIGTFYQRLALEDAPRAILQALAAGELQTLKTRQAEHLRFLFDPSSTAQDIRQQAQRLGRVHALVGVDAALLVRSASIYRRLLNDALDHLTLNTRSRYQMLSVCETRLQDDIQAELDAHAETTAAYLDILGRPVPLNGALWVDVAQTEITAIGALPGVLDAAILRPDPGDVLQIEVMAGQASATIRDITLSAAYQPTLAGTGPQGGALAARAWRQNQILTVPSYAQDGQLAHWRDKLLPLGVRSVMAIPIRGQDDHPALVLRLFGAYPHQFESRWMQQFALGLQQRWESVWRRSQTPPSSGAIAENQAQAYRQRLFSGGLVMAMQPIIDLDSGRLCKVEALARLDDGTGQLLAPASFLPSLGAHDLTRLFRLGLDQALHWLRQWDAQGLTIDISVNLPVHTLIDSGLEQIVMQTLDRHGLPASRLTLEILETQEFDQGAPLAAIDRLRRLGVQFAIDDLGTGYSSLERVSSVQFSAIKVDQSLVRHMRQAPLQALALIGALSQLGKDLGREVIVEGVEDEGILEAVQLLGASHAQGFGIARPMLPQALPEWWAQWQAKPLAGSDAPLTTALGALAYQWMQARMHPAGCAAPLEQCRLTGFLRRPGIPATRLASSHARLHADTADAAAVREFTALLVDLVREEAADLARVTR